MMCGHHFRKWRPIGRVLDEKGKSPILQFFILPRSLANLLERESLHTLRITDRPIIRLSIVIQEDETFTGSKLCLDRIEFIFATQTLTPIVDAEDKAIRIAPGFAPIFNL